MGYMLGLESYDRWLCDSHARCQSNVIKASNMRLAGTSRAAMAKRKCLECPNGEYQNLRGPGRFVLHYDGRREVPIDVVLPECLTCGSMLFSPETIEAIDSRSIRTILSPLEAFGCGDDGNCVHRDHITISPR